MCKCKEFKKVFWLVAVSVLFSVAATLIVRRIERLRIEREEEEKKDCDIKECGC